MELANRRNISLILIIFFIMSGIIGSFLMFETAMNDWVESASDSLQSGEGQSVSFISKMLASVFVIALLTFDVLLPVPSSIVSAFSANALGMGLGVFSIWFGLTLGSCFGYWVGRYSDKLLLSRWLKSADHDKAKKLSGKLGLGALITMRGVPVLAETSVIAAGIVRYPWVPFFVATTLANFGLALAYGFVGAKSGVETPFLAVLAGSILVPLLAWGCQGAWQAIKSRSFDSQVSDQEQQEAQKKTLTLENALDTSNATVHNEIVADFAVSYRYPVKFTHNAFAKNNRELVNLLTATSHSSQQSKVFVIIDSGVAEANSDLTQKIETYFSWNADSVQLLDSPLVFDGGERCKQYEVIESLYAHMWKLGLDRHAFVIAIGGGAVLDCVGYACSTFHRGVKLIRMPSTVLAQNDAGVGVKNGYNEYQAKNLIGSFAPPNAVLNDFALLENLTNRDKLAGLAEAVKVAAIRNPAFFAWMEAHQHALAAFEPKAMQYAIKECARLHIAQITGAGDPFETGSARPLDYGHWSAHKLEAIAHYAIRHGEAVAIGMALDAIYASEMDMLAQEECDRLINLLFGLGFALWHPAQENLDENDQPMILKGVEEFRQHLGGELCITMLSEIGVGEEVHYLDMNALKIALDKLNSLAKHKVNPETEPELPPITEALH